MACASLQPTIAEMRRYLERAARHGREQGTVLQFGVEAIDQCLPQGGLPRGHLHEAIEGGAASQYAGLATLFVAGILARMKGPVLWCLRGREPHSWILEACDATGHLALPAALAERSVAAGEERRAATG
ncbi:MAG TPA: hypothetical protein VGG11_01520 [Xanthobacteraceae bacterium]|jgi:hypothetical protein